MKKIISIIIFLSLLTTAVLAKEYKRIISLAPSVTQSLYELGLDNEVVGITIFCPQGKSKKEIIGTLLEPDLEKIVLLKADLIISTKEGNNKAAVEKLTRMGLDVYVMETAENFSEICSHYYDLAKKVNREKNAKKIIADSKKTVESIYNKIEVVNMQTVFLEVGAKPLYSAGKQSFVNDYNRFTKTVNVYKEINRRYPQIDIEDVLKKNPDIIILVNMGDISLQETKNWLKYKNINAVKNNKVFMLDVNDIFTPTPLTFAIGVEIISKIIYPEIFGAK
ncbi:ABC transporter substrate-binding protein [Endomicrobium proavitum]|uniref:Vitamin B12 ABC transporter substrate-binding protein BtuF n=1 Tax=Endomicrobium proavitum TaxID=1408281 RepID=A0A0G3WJU8_9BACT|nr:helical backbone metal receptor [Endomicrobium proavitum]AKL97774.1 vitamin B12 ABC transporter substrate-binding protein BtuF [Endomicrobium proavitum]